MMHVVAGATDFGPAQQRHLILGTMKQKRTGSAAAELQRRESEADAGVELRTDSKHLLVWQQR